MEKELWTAALNGRESDVAKLLKSVSKVDCQFGNMNGWHESVLFTPLTAAALRGHTKVVELLWKAGANLEHKDPTYGWNALTLAAAHGHVETVRALIGWGADKNSHMTYGDTPLTYAAHNNCVEVVKVLIELGVDIDLPTRPVDGTTALQMAAKDGRKEVVAVLLAAGAKRDGAAESAKTEEIRTMIKNYHITAEEIAKKECNALGTECATICQQAAQAPARRDLMQKRDVLLSQYNAARTAKPVDYAHLSTLGESLEALKLESAKVTLSEEDHLTLVNRHKALVQKVEAKCHQLLQSTYPDLLASLAEKLTTLQAVDVSGLPTSGGKAYVEPAAKPHDAAKLQRLQTEYKTFEQKLAHAPARRDLMQRAEDVAQRLAAAKAAKPVDFALAAKLMKEEQALQKESEQLPMSETEYKELGAKHAALVQQVQGMCEDLVAARQYRLLRDLAAQLTALRALDLTASTSTAPGEMDPSVTDPVWVPSGETCVPVSAEDPPSTDTKTRITTTTSTTSTTATATASPNRSFPAYQDKRGLLEKEGKCVIQ